MQLGQTLVVKPSKLIRKLKLEDWNTEYNAYKKENVERKLDHLSRQMSELQYKLFADKSQSLLIILQGHHTITAEVIRVPLQANQPVEHDLAKWDINVV